MKKFAAILLALTLFSATAVAETTFDGTVTAGETVCVSAPFGGTVSAVSLRAGQRVSAGDAIATVETTRVYAPADGVVTGVFGQPGDSADDVTTRYGAVLYIAPERKYTLSCDVSRAYSTVDTKFVTIGETVYLSCSADGDHTAVGVITAIDGTSYTVETISGELLMSETAYVYRSESYTTRTRIGRGTVSRTAEYAVAGTGSILYMHVADGQQVTRGQLLFETVTGALDGLAAMDDAIVSDADGIVETVSVSAGTAITKGDTVITVCPEDSYLIEALVGEYDIGEISEGDPVSLTFGWDEEGKQIYAGQVEMISRVSESDTDEASYRAYIRFTPDERVRLGMTVTVTTQDAPAEAAD